MECKQYEPGDVLWRAGNKVDFLATIHSGEIVVEYRVNNSKIHSARLTAGDYLKPRDLNGIDTQSSVLARANTDVKLYVLPAEQLAGVQSKLLSSKNTHSSKHGYPGLWRGLFLILVIILILVMNRADAIRILTGVFSLRAYQENTSFHTNQDFLRILQYTEVIDPDAVFAQNQMGMIWYQSNDLQLSKTAYMQALEIDQNNGPALNNLAVIDFLNGQTLQAALAQQKAVQQDPNRALMRYNLGVLLADQSRYPEAIREFKEASYIEPAWALPYIQRGAIYIKIQDYPHAEEEARAATRLAPQQQSAHLILAIAQHNQGDEQGALKSIESAVQIAPQDPVTLFYKALILQRLGKSETALQILQQLLDLTTDPQEITRIRTEIDAIHFYLGNASSGTERKEE
jgi:tetratricopeptide (TPR) repeat protein